MNTETQRHKGNTTRRRENASLDFSVFHTSVPLCLSVHIIPPQCPAPESPATSSSSASSASLPTSPRKCSIQSSPSSSPAHSAPPPPPSALSTASPKAAAASSAGSPARCPIASDNA